MSVITLNSHRDTSESFINHDLIWNLQGAKDKAVVTRFLKSFESRLCVMSTSINQLYSSYSIEKSTHHDRLMVLPAPYAYHDTFTNITADAMTPTNLFVVPGSMLAANNYSLYLAWRQSGQSKFVGMPLWQGLERLMHLATADDPFLPVITTGDLRYLRQKTPIMHLNRLDVSKLGHLSRFQIADIQSTIESKIYCSSMCA